MTSINPQKGFSLMEAVIASGLFAFTFASSLQLYLYIFGQWEQQGYYQQTHQQLMNDAIQNTIDAANNNGSNLLAVNMLNHEDKNNPRITHTTLSRPIPQSVKLSKMSTNVTMLQTTLLTTEPYNTHWHDIQTMMPFTSISAH